MADDTAPWRPEPVAGLRLLARISDALHRRGLPRPILVGGAAAEYYSASVLMTGDIDLASPVQPELEEELLAHGFICPVGPGHTPLGWVHPDLDRAYLEASIRDESSGDYGIDDIPV